MKRKYWYKKPATERRDVVKEVAAKVLELMQEFGEDWKRPWTQAGMPIRVSEKVPYRGVNVLLLGMTAFKEGYVSHHWGTFKQWLALDHPIRKGQHSPAFVVFYKPVVKQKGEGEDPEVFRVMKAYPVFNGDQAEGWVDPAPESAGSAGVLDQAEAFVANTGAVIVTNQQGAFYSPIHDRIAIPGRETFIDTDHSQATENYYSTLLHELTHWTGAAHRLNRDMKGRFGSESYAAEELVAELGSAFLCALLGITPAPRPDHAQYLAGWMRKVADTPRAFTDAVSKAERAVGFLEGLQGEGPAQAEEAVLEEALA